MINTVEYKKHNYDVFSAYVLFGPSSALDKSPYSNKNGVRDYFADKQWFASKDANDKPIGQSIKPRIDYDPVTHPCVTLVIKSFKIMGILNGFENRLGPLMRSGWTKDGGLPEWNRAYELINGAIPGAIKKGMKIVSFNDLI